MQKTTASAVAETGKAMSGGTEDGGGGGGGGRRGCVEMEVGMEKCRLDGGTDRWI